MALHCPECGSDDVRRVAIAYEKGVEKTRSITGMGGGLFSLFGPAFGLGVAVTRGKNTTLQAERIAPPQKARPILAAFIVFIGAMFIGAPLDIFVMFLFHWIGLGQKFGSIIGGLMVLALAFGLPIYLLYAGFSHNLKLPKKLEEWNKLYTCERCGEVFGKEAGVTKNTSNDEPRHS